MDDLLERVERPSRYLGNEIGAIKKDLSQVSFRVALAYPDLYEIGMSNTGLHILYYLLNQIPEVAAERAYLPADDLEALLRTEGRPLCTLENRIPLGEVDLLGIQLPHELACTNIVKMLRLGNIPVWASERTLDHPYVVGGGPTAFAAEPVAPFYDAILLGDGEEALPTILRAIQASRRDGASRLETLRRLARITGVYVPRLYEPEYAADGKLAAMKPTGGAPPLVHKALVEDLEGAFYPEQAIVPYAQTVHTRLGVEVMRGCTVGCRFCQAGIIYRPLRERSPKRILDLAACGLGATGFEEVSLLSLDTGDYTLIDPLTKELLARTAERRVGLSLPSLRAGSLTDDVIGGIQQVRRTSFTIAPEAGTQRLRDVINKNISDEEIFETVERVAKGGWSAIKLYFMVGFPTETDEDLDGLVRLVLRCRELGRKHVSWFNCTASIGTLIPKPWTAFQWDEQLDPAESRRRMSYVANRLRRARVSCKYHDPKTSWLEGVLARGDRRLAPVIVAVEGRGGGFESWQDRLQLDLWTDAFSEHGIDPDANLRARGHDEVLPWDHLSPRVTKKYLLADRKKIDRLSSPTTFDCRDDLCSGCAVCFEDDVRNRLAKYDPDPMGDGRRLPMALTGRGARSHGVSRQLAGSTDAPARDQAAKAGADALAAKLRRRRPAKPGKRRWAVTPGAPGLEGPAPAFTPDAIAVEEAAQRHSQSASQRVVEPSPAPATAPALGTPGDRATPSAPNPALALPDVVDGLPEPTWHYRLVYQRRGALRFLSHRETSRTIYRILTRSDLPIAYTRGFNPKPRIAFGPPLPVGAESLHEQLDLHLTEEVAPSEILDHLQPLFPSEEGLAVARVEPAFGKKSAHSERGGARWSVTLSSLGVSALEAQAGVDAWAARSTFLLETTRPEKKSRTVDLKLILDRLELDEQTLRFDLRQWQQAPSAKAVEAIGAVLGLTPERARRGRFLLLEPLAGRPEPTPALLLASTSPRRKALLESMGVTLQLATAGLDDSTEAALSRGLVARGLAPAAIVGRLALAKLMAALPQAAPGQSVLAADTTVAIDGEAVGKARHRDHARSILARLRGRAHAVHTGVAVVGRDGRLRRAVATSTVHLRAFSDEDLEAFLDADCWQGKAGAYGVQDREFAPLVDRIEGSESNVRGLPLEVIEQLLEVK